MSETRKVVKRDGRLEDYNKEKIVKAVSSAFNSVGKHLPDNVIDSFVDQVVINLPNPCGVEEIQNKIENELMRRNCFSVARAYILYREKHKEDRILKDRLSYMMGYIKSSDNAATSSEEDSNANVSTKNVANLNGETYKNLNRRLQRMWVRNKLKEMFPEVAKQYEKDLENHIIYTHDESSFSVPTNYCEAVSLYPLLLHGTSTMDGLRTTPPKNLNSFCGQLVNLTFLLAAQCKGAVAFGEFFNFFDYFCVKEWGDNWDSILGERASSEVNNNQKTVRQVIEQAFQQIVFSWNQPAGNRSFQSPFINISYYDSNYWKALFEDFSFPDGSKPEWRRVDLLQKMFMKWFNATRKKTLMAFPVETMALLTDGKDVLDKDYKDFTAEMWHEGHSFFLYLSDSPDSLSSCCFSKDTKFLWKSSTSGVHNTTFEEFLNLPYENMKENFKIFHNGSWIKGKVISLSNRPMYKVTTYNNKEFIMSDNHINVVYDGEKRTEELTTDDYLMFNTDVLNEIPEKSEHLTYEQGLLVGLFIGDGTFDPYICLDGSSHGFQLSLNKEKWDKAKPYLDKLGKFTLHTPYNNVYPVVCQNKELTSFISKWTGNNPRETRSYNKNLSLNCLLQSVEFRRGILDGWYITDGGNSNRCYTTSKALVENMEILCTSLGLQTIIDISDRTDEKVVIRGIEYDRNHPLYCLRWYSKANHRTNKDRNASWKKKNNSMFWRIKAIEKVKYTDSIYCIECDNQDEPYFTLPSGLITHNCRLRNQIEKNEFSFTNGLTGVRTGSCNVITLNLNRIVQDWFKGYKNVSFIGQDSKSAIPVNQYRWVSLKDYLTNILDRVYKYHTAYKTMLYELEEKGMLTASTAGYISMKDLFSTIGINGLNEAAEFLGIECSDNSEYKKFVKFITSTISEENKKHSTKSFKFNQEFVPAEQLGSRNYNWDKADGYKVPSDRVLYNSYFYLADNPDTSVLEKLRLHGREYTETLDGGVGCHIGLSDHLSKEQYLYLIEYAIKVGCSYFTFNIPNSECKDCGHIEKVPIEECPICGSKNISQWTRIIGYLRPIENFDKYRQIEAKRRVYSKDIK